MLSCNANSVCGAVLWGGGYLGEACIAQDIRMTTVQALKGKEEGCMCDEDRPWALPQSSRWNVVLWRMRTKFIFQDSGGGVKDRERRPFSSQRSVWTPEEV